MECAPSEFFAGLGAEENRCGIRALSGQSGIDDAHPQGNLVRMTDIDLGSSATEAGMAILRLFASACRPRGAPNLRNPESQKSNGQDQDPDNKYCDNDENQ